jgi:glutamate receptor, ionotropic, plant
VKHSNGRGSVDVAVLGAARGGGRGKGSVSGWGALFTYDSTIGRAAQLTIELTVDDVNADRTVLAGTTLKLMTLDTNCSGFLGTIEGSLLASSSP